MKTVTDFPREVVEHADMGITMPDGCRLSARVWMPVDAEEHPVPVILEHIPYRKRDGTIARDELTHPWFAGHGYACIRTDMRGNGESEGLMEDEYTQQELDDACAVIAWAAEQPWCNGRVGMMGISWGGFNGLQVAALQPPALKAVISICSTVDRYADDIHTKGGCLMGENFGWAVNMLSYSSRPPDPALVGEKWKEMWLKRLEAQPFLLTEWLRHRHRDAYWRHGSVCEDYDGIKAAVLAIGGWHDGYHNAPARVVANLKAPAKAIVGPWNHKYPHFAAPKPAIGFLQEAKRWWDRWLKDELTGVEEDPAYRAWLMDSVAPKRWLSERPGRWVAESQWPSPDIEMSELPLSADGTLGDEGDTFEAVISSPQDLGATTGEYFPFAYSDELPDEQSPDDALSLCFDSEPAEEDTDIVGAPEITLRLASDKAQAQVAVRLCDLRPDGTSAFITYGVMNLNHRECHDRHVPLVPGEMFDIKFPLDQIAYRLPAGHRLRVAISTSYWPMIWPVPEAAAVTLFKGSLRLPVRPLSQGDEWIFEEPEGAPEWRREELRPSNYRRINDRSEDGACVTTVECDFGESRDQEHGLRSGSRMTESWSIHADDPLCAEANAEWEQTGGREGAMWRTQATARMFGDATDWHISATLTAELEGEVLFERSFEERLPRV